MPIHRPSGFCAPCSRFRRTSSSRAHGGGPWASPAPGWGRSSFPAAFAASVVAHGLYIHLAYGRGAQALWGLIPMLVAMALVSWLVVRDLQTEPSPASADAQSALSGRRSRLSFTTPPPSLTTVRAALSQGDEPIKVRWVLFGALVIQGAMIAGVASGIVVARAAGIDLASIDNHSVRTAAPVLPLAIGLLASLPVSGWMVARAAGVRTLLEPALSAVLALSLSITSLGFAAPSTVVFALALSPIAWVLACVGAWTGRAT